MDSSRRQKKISAGPGVAGLHPPIRPTTRGEAMTADTETPARTGFWRSRVLVLLPLVLFLGLAALFLVRLGAGDASRIPSVLIGRPAPATNLPPLAGLERDGKPVPGIDETSLKGVGTVLNVWASLCVPCVDEAPLLVRLARDARLKVVGINYKDTPDNARRFLARY